MRLDKLGKDKKGLKIDLADEVDFENIFTDDAVTHDDDWDDDGTLKHSQDDEMDDVMYQDYYYMDDDDEYEFMEDDAMDDMEIEEIKKNREARDAMTEDEKKLKKQQKKEARQEKLGALKKQRNEEGKKHLKTLKEEKKAKKKSDRQMMNEGEAVEKTYLIEEEGWYRYCVDATYAPVRLCLCLSTQASLSNSTIFSLSCLLMLPSIPYHLCSQVEIEFDLRASGDLGKPNAKTTHIQTYERHDMLMSEKKLLAKLTSNGKAGNVSEEDLKKTKEQITKMNRLLNEIREKQVNERHRLGVHKAVNEHSHSRMVVGSLFETVFYIVVSGFQVYTIRKWFSGNPILAY